MQYNIFVIFLYFITFYEQYDFIHGKPLISCNIKSVTKDEYSFVVSIKKIVSRIIIIESTICTGSLVSYSLVLTAEHCLNDIGNDPYLINVGSNEHHNCKKYFPKWYLSYDQWAKNSGIDLVFITNDIAVINLLENVIAEIKLASISTIERYGTPVGVNADIVGWGNLENNIKTNALKKVKVEIITNTECGAAASTILGEVIRVPSKYMCTKAKPYALLGDGDSGGPLLYEGKIIAINRGLFPNDNPQFYPHAANIHLHIEYYISFINATLCML